MLVRTGCKLGAPGSQYRHVLKKAKLRYIPFHCLRDTFATLLLMANVPLTYISEQLGHKDPSVTVEHYARWLPGGSGAWWRR